MLVNLEEKSLLTMPLLRMKMPIPFMSSSSMANVIATMLFPSKQILQLPCDRQQRCSHKVQKCGSLFPQTDETHYTP
jgi:hypothetical protein